MKILDLCEFYSQRGGGVRSYLTKLFRAAGEAGHEVVVVAPGPRDEELHDEGGRIVRYRAPSMPYDPTYHWPWRIDRMREVVLRERPDVLQVSSPFLPMLVAPSLRRALARAGHRPLLAYVYHSDPVGCYLRPAVRRAFGRGRMADVAMAPGWAWMRAVSASADVTVVAGHWLERLLKQHGCQRVVTVPFGITHEDFGPHHRDLNFRSDVLGPLAQDLRARLVLIAGRLAFDKRQRLVVEGLLRVARRRPVALVVLGDGPERARLEALASGLPRSIFLKFTRNREEYARVLASVDALVHGSQCETYGFVLAEALASGTPVVLPDEGGATVFADPAASESYPWDGGPEAVAAAAERLFQRDPAALRVAAERVGRAQPHLREHFRNLFSLYEGRWAGEGETSTGPAGRPPHRGAGATPARR
jgi:alpha-1,6-mannosyltransferase